MCIRLLRLHCAMQAAQSKLPRWTAMPTALAEELALKCHTEATGKAKNKISWSIRPFTKLCCFSRSPMQFQNWKIMQRTEIMYSVQWRRRNCLGAAQIHTLMLHNISQLTHCSTVCPGPRGKLIYWAAESPLLAFRRSRSRALGVLLSKIDHPPAPPCSKCYNSPRK